MGSDAVLYKKNRVRYVKSFTKDRSKRVWTGQVLEYNLKTGRIRPVSKKFKSISGAEIKKNRVVFQNTGYEKKSLKLTKGNIWMYIVKIRNCSVTPEQLRK